MCRTSYSATEKFDKYVLNGAQRKAVLTNSFIKKKHIKNQQYREMPLRRVGKEIFHCRLYQRLHAEKDIVNRQ